MQYFSFIALALPLLLVTQVVAICPGFNYGIGNVIDEGKLGDRELYHCKYSRFEYDPVQVQLIT